MMENRKAIFAVASVYDHERSAARDGYGVVGRWKDFYTSPQRRDAFSALNKHGPKIGYSD